jgi:hypothetical protein
MLVFLAFYVGWLWLELSLAASAGSYNASFDDVCLG